MMLRQARHNCGRRCLSAANREFGRAKFRAVGLRLPCRFVGLGRPFEGVGGWSFAFQFPVHIAIRAKGMSRIHRPHDLRRAVRPGECRFRPWHTIGLHEKSRREFDRQPRLRVHTIQCRDWQPSVRQVLGQFRSNQTRRATAGLLAVRGCGFAQRVRWDTNFALVLDRNLNRSWGLPEKSLWQ